MNQQNDNSSPSSNKRTPTQVKDIVIEKDNGFDVDWDSIEENVQQSKRHRHRRKTHFRRTGHSTNSATGATKLRHTVSVDEQDDNKKKSPIIKILIAVLILFLCIVIGVLISFFILRYRGKLALLGNQELNITSIDDAVSKDNGKTVTYKGETYTFNPYVTSVLFMGVDKEELELENNVVGTGGQSDAIYLLTYDTTGGKLKIISFSRDTMVDINTYTTSGKYAGVENAQLCLAYAYGDGKAASAENVVTSLQRIIYNIPINAYFAMDLSAIKVLNDDIGGVNLTSLETFNGFTEGENVTLMGDMAEIYVRARDVSKLDSNITRMARQQQYLTAFSNQLVPAVQKDISLPLDLYNDAKNYVITDLTPSKITYLTSAIVSSYDGFEMVSVPGEITASETDGKAQFIPDKVALYEIILDTFYTKE